MGKSNRRWITLLFLALWGAWGAAWAGPGKKAQAAALEDAANEAFAEGQLIEALQLLKKAYALDPRPGLIANQGLVLEKMGEPARAVERFERYLSMGPAAEGREMAELKVDRLKPEVLFVSSPGGAAVTVDGGPEVVGHTPTKVRVLAGAHFAELRLEGFIVARPDFEVRAGQINKVEVPLVRQVVEAPPAQPDRTWAWAATTGGGLALASAAVFGGLTLSELSARDDAGDVPTWEGHADQAHQYSVAAYASLGLSAAAFTLAWWLWE